MESPTSHPITSPDTNGPPAVTTSVNPAQSEPTAAAGPSGAGAGGLGRVGGIMGALVVLLVVGIGAAFVFDVPMPWKASAAQANPDPPPRLGVQLVAETPNTLLVPEDVRQALGIRAGGKDRVYEAKVPEKMRPLVMPGSTALDPARLFRIKVRFAPCEVYEIAKVPDIPANGHVPDSVSPESLPKRELRTGDRVKKGQLLAIVHSVDVGQKKNDLIDALLQLKLDEKILDACDKAGSALSEVFILNAQRNVEADHNNIAKALNTLKAWNIPKKDIDACFTEADEIIKRRGKREHNEADLAKWARVDLVAPEDGVIVERNLSLHEVVNDNSVNLFQIAKVDRLAVFANVPEDEVPALEALPTAKRLWTVKTVGSDPVAGVIDDVGYLIDPSQHTAVVKGHIDNPKEVMRAGQFVTAAVEVPPPPDVVEVPADAVVEDGQTCVVFVQDKDHKDHYTMRRVQPTHRFDKTVFVRSKPFAKGEERTAEEEELGALPKEPLRPGERVLTSGAGELKAALLDLQSQPKK